MAYGNNSNSRSSFGNKPAAQSNAATSPVKYILRTGLFAPTKEGVKSIGSIQLKEAVTLPAGSHINLYEAERKNDKSPVFTLTVKEGKPRTDRK